MTYQHQIDGLRAIAVSSVILYHAGVPFFQAGFIGVDIFFVISGYLISGTLYTEFATNRFSYLDFLERRARRILPALVIVITCSTPIAYLFSYNQQFLDYSKSLIGLGLFSSNIVFWKDIDYFDTEAFEKPLLHTWSLAIEEQYYILFPIFLLIIYRIDKRFLGVSLLSILAISFLVSEWGWRNYPVANFYLLPTRAWELLTGSFLAYIAKTHVYHGKNFPSIFGLLLILITTLGILPEHSTPSFMLIPTLLGVCLVILYGKQNTITYQILSSRLISSVGLISYPAYLWHQPVFAFYEWITFGSDRGPIMSSMLVLSVFTLAYFTFKFVEQPVRQKILFKNQSTFFCISLIALFSMIVIGLLGTIYHSEGSKKIPIHVQSVAKYDGYVGDNFHLIAKSWDIQKAITGVNFFGVDDIEKDRTLLYPLDNGKRNLLVVGNSHAVDFYNVLHHSLRIKKVFNIARFGVQIANIDQSFFETPNYQYADTVVICSLLTNEDLENMEDVVHRIIKDGKRLIISRNMFLWMERANYTKLDKIILAAAKQGQEQRLLMEDVNMLYSVDYSRKKFVSPAAKLQYYQANDRLALLASEYKFELIDRMDYICPQSICKIVGPKIEKYIFDIGHHTMDGAIYYSKIFDRTGMADKIAKTHFE